MINAYQIVNFNDPVSLYYHNKSVKSFAGLKDYITINPIQCVTPHTSTLNLTGPQTTTEKAVIESHMKAMDMIGDNGLIMEHDAYLLEGYEEKFLSLLKYIPECTIWNIGIAAECYTLNKQCVAAYKKMVYNHKGGVMKLLHNAADSVGGKAMWPLKGNTNRCCFGDIPVSNVLKGNGVKQSAPITQHVNLDKGVTVKRRSDHIINEVNNPNVYFGK